MPPRVWAKSEDGRFQWVTLTPKYLPGAIEAYNKSFYVNDSVAIALSLAKAKKSCSQFDKFYEDLAEDGVSIVAVEVATDKVVGAALCKIQYKGDPEKPFCERYTKRPDNDPAFEEYMDFMVELEARIDIFSHFGVDAILDLMFLVTHPDYYRKGIAQKTVATVVELAKALNKGEDVAVPITEEKFPWKKIPIPPPEAVIALFTSPKSQKIGYNLGWDEITVCKYDEKIFQGQTYLSRLDKDNWCTRYMATKITG